jgi:hypothetical protein
MTRQEFEAAWREMPRDERMLIAETVIAELCADWGLDKPEIAFVTLSDNGREVLGRHTGEDAQPTSHETDMIRIDIDTRDGGFAQIDNPWEFLDTAIHEFAHHAQDTLGPNDQWGSNHFIAQGPGSVEMFALVNTHVFLGQIEAGERFAWLSPPSDWAKIELSPEGPPLMRDERDAFTKPPDARATIDFSRTDPVVELELGGEQKAQREREQQQRELDLVTHPKNDPLERDNQKPKLNESSSDPNWLVFRDGG